MSDRDEYGDARWQTMHDQITEVAAEHRFADHRTSFGDKCVCGWTSQDVSHADHLADAVIEALSEHGDVDMVVMGRHLPQDVLDGEPAGLAEHVGLDGITEGGVPTDHDVEGVAGGMVGQAVGANSTNAQHVRVGVGDVLLERPGVRAQAGAADERDGMGRSRGQEQGGEGGEDRAHYRTVTAAAARRRE